MAEWLFEIFSEEIPSRMQNMAVGQIQDLAKKHLREANLAFEDMAALVTPRRLTLRVTGLPLRQEDRNEERKGPRVDAPEKAIEGFLASTGLNRADCEERETPKGTFLFAHQKIAGRETSDILSEVSLAILKNFRWPKSMRWADYGVTWVRPIRSIMNLFDGHVVPLTFGPLGAGNTTQGHRFLSPTPFSVTHFEDYKEKLERHYVILDQDARHKKTQEMLDDYCSRTGLSVVDDGSLLDEVTGLVEWPVLIEGRVDEKFMGLPLEVITTPMRVHQKYFPLQDKEGKLASRFLILGNIPKAKDSNAIQVGNERVLRARLSDAQFFWVQDQKKPLEDYNEKLKTQLFYQGLGSVFDKVKRLEILACALAKTLGEDENKASRAAALCKSDLVTSMVYEFPELEGIMGSYYARLQGEDNDVCDAIQDHYLPKGGDGDLPESPLSRILGIADRVDTLIGFFTLGQKPTGSKDPYALRRAALGTLRLAMDSRMAFSLEELLRTSYRAYNSTGDAPSEDHVVSEVWDFLMERLKNYLRDVQGSPYDHVDAVLCAINKQEPLFLVENRVKALDQFMHSKDGQDLLAAYKRASNIRLAEEKKGTQIANNHIQTSLFVDDTENKLYETLDHLKGLIDTARQSHDFESMMKHLATLRAPVDAFFNGVMVNDPDPKIRDNRFGLLTVVQSTMDHVADFSKVEQK